MSKLTKDTNAKEAAEKRRLAKQDDEQVKLDAIEAKLEKARIRAEESKKQKANKAVAARVKVNPSKAKGNNSLPPKNPKRLGRNESQNDDLEFIMDEQKEPTRAIGKQRSALNKKDPHKRSTLLNAGISASRKGLQDRDQSERSDAHSSFRQPSTNRDTSPHNSP